MKANMEAGGGVVMSLKYVTPKTLQPYLAKYGVTLRDLFSLGFSFFMAILVY